MISHKVRTPVVLGAVIAVLLAVGAASASAHSAEILIQSGTLVYEQIPGIDQNFNNKVTIALKADSLGSYYEVDDPGSTGMFFPAVCTPLDPDQDSIRCPAAGIGALYVRTGTGYSVTKTTTASITILAPTPATLSGGSVTNSGGPRTSDITAGPVGGNVLYGNPGTGTLDGKNGFPDTIHSCPGDTVIADPSDTVIPDCAPPPDPPAPPAPPASPPPPSTPGAPPSPGLGPTLTPTTTPATAPSSEIAITFKRRQQILKRRAVFLSLSVATPLTVKARGTIALRGRAGVVRLQGVRVHIRPIARGVTVRLRVPGRRLRALRRALAKTHRHVYAQVQVTASDPASGSSFALARRILLIR
jgi:hypothetical protein